MTCQRCRVNQLLNIYAMVYQRIEPIPVIWDVQRKRFILKINHRSDLLIFQHAHRTVRNPMLLLSKRSSYLCERDDCAHARFPYPPVRYCHGWNYWVRGWLLDSVQWIRRNHSMGNTNYDRENFAWRSDYLTVWGHTNLFIKLSTVNLNLLEFN